MNSNATKTLPHTTDPKPILPGKGDFPSKPHPPPTLSW